MQANQASAPNPQFAREKWQSLNGLWQFGFEKAKPGFHFSSDAQKAIDRAAAADDPLQIQVPFCPESTCSGIGYTGFINEVWYRKTVAIHAGNRRVFLHIGAADYLTTVLVNGKEAGRHKGGYTSFCFEITDLVQDGENELFIFCEDNVRDPLVMRGKQSERKESHGCDYTRTTGIWQSVWLEYTPLSYIKSFRLYPDAANGLLTVQAQLCGSAAFACTATYDGKQVGAAAMKTATGVCTVQLPLTEQHLWEAGNGRLYDLVLRFGDDTVYSYFGLRDVGLDGMKFMLNGKSVFQRLVLDQGFYRNGIYTAPDDDALQRDIELSMDLGFNGARLHQKVFDPRFLYHCDRLGYLVWGEYPNWGLDYSSPKSVAVFLQEWGESVARDCNHPAIIGWCPFNEAWDYHGRPQYDPLLATVYHYTKAVDPTRPCIDTSGNFHVVTDLYDVHDYCGDPAVFKQNYDRLMTEGDLFEAVLQGCPGRQKHNGGPVFVSEYGGIKWAGDNSVQSWGYGEDVTTPQAFAARYCGLTDALVQNDKICGFCYTQLYDIEQEQNGLYTYDRQKKFSEEIYDLIRASNTAKAAIEKEA